MNPTAAAPQVYGQANQIFGQGQQGIGQYTGQYNTDLANYQSAQNNLQNYQQNMPNLGNLYNQNVQSAEQQYGVNPQEIQNANAALQNMQTTLANLPNAIQQRYNGGGTAAQAANALSQSAGNMQGEITGQGNALNQAQTNLQSALGQAGQSTAFTGQTQQMQIGALQDLVQNSQAQEQQAMTLINYYQGLEQAGVNLTEGEQNALSNAENAAAAAQNAQTQAKYYAFLEGSGLGGGGASPTAQSTIATMNAARTPVPGTGNTVGSVANYGNPPVNYGLLGTIGNFLNSPSAAYSTVANMAG